MNAPIGSVFVSEPGHWIGVVSLDMDAYHAIAARTTQADAAHAADAKYHRRDVERLARITAEAKRRIK